MEHQYALVWLRRDLRWRDNTALQAALESSRSVSLLFVFDPDLIAELPSDDRRISFIWQSLDDLNDNLRKKNCPAITILHGRPIDVVPHLMNAARMDALFYNHDYEPAAIRRDGQVTAACQKLGVTCRSFKDQVLFEKNEILKDDSAPYKVFTAYKNKWLTMAHHQPARVAKTPSSFWRRLRPLRSDFKQVTSLKQIGFSEKENVIAGGETSALKQWRSFLRHALSDYHKRRDRPDLGATSRLSAYLRFGNLSIRQCLSDLLNDGSTGARSFVAELVWREFFMMILFHFPHVVKSAFNPVYDKLQWTGRRSVFRTWCEGRTGYPIVDAGMRELNETGFMHNRVRMITASFLVKHLHVNWRWGEGYFARKLLDFELSSNNGNWQWVSGTGVDAAPYFRIFNPVTQGKKFDPQADYIRRWIAELKDLKPAQIHSITRRPQAAGSYSRPMIDLEVERKVCLSIYGTARRSLRNLP